MQNCSFKKQITRAETWLPYGFLKVKWSIFGLFWNSLPELKWFGHFLALLNVEENSMFWSLFWRNLTKICNILWNSNKFLKKIWPFFIFEDLAFSIFWGPGNPGLNVSDMYFPKVAQKRAQNYRMIKKTNCLFTFFNQTVRVVFFYRKKNFSPSIQHFF